MSTQTRAQTHESLSIVRGPPLNDEPGLGILTMPGYFRAVTQRFAEREALVMRTSDGVERWTYATLWERAVEVARALIASGVGRDSRVGIMLTNRPEYLAALFGTTLAGGVAVTLSTFSTQPELEYLLQASSVSILLFERNVAKKDFAEVLCDLEPAVAAAQPGQVLSIKFPFLRHLVMLDTDESAPPRIGAIEPWRDFLDRGEATPVALVDERATATKPADVGAIFFSSGTTATPKGIVHRHRAVAIQWWRWPRSYGLDGPVRCWTANGFFWSGQFSMVIGCAFSTGGAIVLQPLFLADEALALIETERVSIPFARPHQWARMEAEPNFGMADLSSLRYIDELTPLAKHPTVQSKWAVPQAFGTTETLAICTAVLGGTPMEERGGGYGWPLPGNSLKIVDPLTGVVVPRGQRGEIGVKGPTLMLGYLGKTADETFDEEGFYRTGDGGYVDETGRLFWEGRLTDIIKTGGANVSPEEVDIAIRTYPGVKVAQTVGFPDDMLGEMVVACVVPHEGATLDEPALRDFLRERLASYKVPRRILFIRDDEVALTVSGAKIKADVLRRLVAERLGSAG